MNGKIKNFHSLASSPTRTQALLIAEAALSAIDTKAVVRRTVAFRAKKNTLEVGGRHFDLGKFDRVMVFGFGKAAFDAVSALYEIVGSRVTCGFVIDLKEGDIGAQIVCRRGTHPTPTVINVQATKDLIAMLSGMTERDLVLCVVSGGGSSLLCYPHDMTCETESDIIRALTNQGATITELNTVRKHISYVKGGNLAKMMHPATVAGLIFSDVPGGNLGDVASGPTVLDTTTVTDAAQILDHYNVLRACKLPHCRLLETPKDPALFANVHNFLIVSADAGLRAMREKADDLGLSVTVWDKNFSGEARIVAHNFVAATRGPGCFLAAGESTVTMAGNGSGGRNQELALAALSELPAGAVLLALATDGYDNTPAGGAIVDASTIARAKALGLLPADFLKEHNSYPFFQAVGDALDTGLTGSNVSDLLILVRG